MSTQVIKGEVSICRSSNGLIYLRAQCQDSRQEFLEIAFTPEQFANAVTNLHMSDIDMKVSNLERVGKKRVTEPREVLSPLTDYSRDVQQKWLEENRQEEGWTLNAYLGSQNSMKHVDNGTLLRYSVYKFV